MKKFQLFRNFSRIPQMYSSYTQYTQQVPQRYRNSPYFSHLRPYSKLNPMTSGLNHTQSSSGSISQYNQTIDNPTVRIRKIPSTLTLADIQQKTPQKQFIASKKKPVSINMEHSYFYKTSTNTLSTHLNKKPLNNQNSSNHHFHHHRRVVNASSSSMQSPEFNTNQTTIAKKKVLELSQEALINKKKTEFLAKLIKEPQFIKSLSQSDSSNTPILSDVAQTKDITQQLMQHLSTIGKEIPELSDAFIHINQSAQRLYDLSENLLQSQLSDSNALLTGKRSNYIPNTNI